MGLLDLIEKLRKQPKFIRVQVMWLTVTICMIVIFSFWIWSLKDLKISEKSDAGLSGNLKKVQEEVPSLWSSLGAGISNAMKSAKDLMDKKEPTMSPSATPPENGTYFWDKQPQE